MDLAWRPVRHEDPPAWQRLLASVEKVDRTGQSFDTGDLLEELHRPCDRAGRQDRRVRRYPDGRVRRRTAA